MKRLILILSFVSFLNADYYYRIDNICVYDVYERYTQQGDQLGYCYYKSSNSKKKCNRYATLDDFADGYTYSNGACTKTQSNNNGGVDANCSNKEDFGIFPSNTALGMSCNDYWLLIGFMALLCSYFFWDRLAR